MEKISGLGVSLGGMVTGQIDTCISLMDGWFCPGGTLNVEVIGMLVGNFFGEP